VLVRAPTHQPASFVFGKLNDDTGLDGSPGWSVRASPAYVVCCGSLLAQFTILGYDASAHLAEETRKASRNAPIGIISSLVCSALLGFFLLLALLFSIQDFDALLNTQFNQPIMHILCDLFGRKGSTIIFSMILCCVWSCGLLSMTSNSRLIFALSRDRALVCDSRFLL
jgi:amino acid transporter